MACLVAIQNKVKMDKAKKVGATVSVCAKEDSCAGCTNTLCGGKTFTSESIKREKEDD